MLEANKNLWVENAFGIYNKNLLRRRFNSLRVSGLASLTESKPSIFFANHSSWWDGLVAFQISQSIKADSFIMMEEKQLKKLFFFRKLGAFSVVRENPREAVKSLNYAINLLKENRTRTLWIFPQGKILPNDARPIRFYNGISRIIGNLENCVVSPLAVRYEFLGDYKPDIFVKIGQPETFKSADVTKSKDLTEKFENDLTELLDELKHDVASTKTINYKNIV
jgi:1-acyl-sn-glycerol-3-phosphate acyltransferase